MFKFHPHINEQITEKLQHFAVLIRKSSGMKLEFVLRDNEGGKLFRS
jgi:hypothetical protein